jgi:uncharacterized LabA/DUF88 family protein/cold shock CspA family protein
MASDLIRIGVFYDGNYFFHVSNFYNFIHSRRTRISISGLHEFVRKEISKFEGVDERYCKIVDSHYFRGRISASEAQSRDKLFAERTFDDILMKEGVVTHYLPLSNRMEKGIDVWLALEAYELAMYKKYDVLVMVASDGDYVPLVRKLNTLGTRVMVLGWDFEFTDNYGHLRKTVTSIDLLEEVTYPIQMTSLIDDKTKNHSYLFVNKDYQSMNQPSNGYVQRERQVRIPEDGPVLEGVIQNLKEGYGFIRCTELDHDLFFYWEDVEDDFNELEIGDVVSFVKGQNERGDCAFKIRIVREEPVDLA